MAMDSTILDIVIKAKDEASKVFNELGKNAKKTSNPTDKATKALQKLSLLGVGALASTMVIGVKNAANLQSAVTRLATTAGENVKNLGSDTSGLLNISDQTATSVSALAQGLYTINSAGFHGGKGLTVLTAAAEGAKSENADLGTVTNALTTILNNYHLKANKAVGVTDQMLAAVSRGKMNFQDFAGSLAAVLPAASSIGMSFAQVAGAEATMTAQGMSAQQASQDLGATIRSLSGGNSTAISWMQKLGINVTNLQNDLGSKGLTYTIQQVENAIKTHLNSAGDVAVNAFNQTASATQDLKIMLSKMPSNIRDLSQQLMNGTTSVAAYRLQTQMMGPLQANMAKQFETLYNKTQSFNSVLTSGNPAVITAAKALQDMMGGATGMNTALMLGGKNLPIFESNVKAVAEAGKHAGKNVDKWGLIQKTFNFQLQTAKESVSNLVTSLGVALLPALTKIITPIASIAKDIAEWTTKHKKLTAIILGSLTAILGVTAAILTFHTAYVKIKEAYGVFKTAAMAVKAFSFWTNIASLATKAWTGVQIAFNAVMDANPIALVIIAVAALIAIVIVLVKHWRQVESFFMKLWDGVMNLFHSRIGIILAAIFPFIGIPHLIMAHWQAIVSFFSQVWNDIWNGTRQFVGMVVQIFIDMPTRILQAVAGFGTLLFDSGRNLIQGLVNGIDNVAHIATDAVKSLGSDVVKGFKSLLGIHSPSTVFAEAGKNIGLGLIQGITGTNAQVKNAVNGLVPPTLSQKVGGAVTPASVPTGNGTSANTGLATQGTGGGSSSVTLNVNIGVYAGTQSEKQKVATEIWQSLMQVARSQNKAGNVPDLGIRPI